MDWETILRNDPIIDQICANLSFNELQDLRNYLRTPVLKCRFSIPLPDGTNLELKELDDAIVYLYPYLKERGLNLSLFDMIFNNNLPMVRKLLDLGAGVNLETHVNDGTNSYRTTPLIYAVQAGIYDVVVLLVQKGVEVNQIISTDGTSALTAALLNGYHHSETKPYHKILTFLLEEGANLNQANAIGFPYIFYAFGPDIATVLPEERDNYYVNIEKTIEIALPWLQDVNVADSNRTTLLMWVLGFGLLRPVKTLLERGARVNDVTPSGFSVLNAGTYNQGKIPKLDMLQLLLKYGLDLNLRRPGDDTALIRAIKANQVEEIRFLIENGADIDIQGVGGRTALIVAISKNYDSLVKFLLKKGANIMIRADPIADGVDAVAMAVLRGNYYIFSLLLEAGADLEVSREIRPNRTVKYEDRYRKESEMRKVFG